MSQSFKTSSASKTFGQFSETETAGNYINKKKIKSKYCVSNICSSNLKVSNQSDLLMLKSSYDNIIFSCLDLINHNNLYINLITELDLSCYTDIIPILDTSGNNVPAIINSEGTTYTRYNIDPSGNLFGNTTCGLNNFLNYLVYNV